MLRCVANGDGNSRRQRGGRRRMMVEEWEEDVDVEKVAVVHVHDSVAQNS